MVRLQLAGTRMVMRAVHTSNTIRLPRPRPAFHRVICSLFGTAEGAPVVGLQHNMPRRPVVTAFIRRDDHKFLVVRRSDKVRTYPLTYGAISGGVEGNESLLDRARAKILQETSLTPKQLQLVCFGRPLLVDDKQGRFVVHPFLFHLMNPAATITLNWENDKYKWVIASAIAQLQHVPLLPETLDCLLLPSYMQQHVDYLKADRNHGAAQLAAYVLQACKRAAMHEQQNASVIAGGAPDSSVASSSGGPHPVVQRPAQQQQVAPAAGVQPEFVKCLEAYSNFCFQMAAARPSMAAVANMCADVMLQLRQELAARTRAFEPTAGLVRSALLDVVNKLEPQLQKQQAATIHNAAHLLPAGACVLTTSLSSTVAAALIEAHKQATEPPAAPAGRTDEHQGGNQVAPAAAVATRSQKPEVAAQGAAGSVDDTRLWPSSSGVGKDQSCDNSWIARFHEKCKERASSTAGGSNSNRRSSSSSSSSGISVVVCEARPLCEGVIMAQRLAAAGLNATLITDAQAGVFASDVNLVMLGADAVTPHGPVNKVGSKLLALAGKAAGVPVVVVTDQLKVSPGHIAAMALPNTMLEEGHEEKDVNEVTQVWPFELASNVARAADDVGDPHSSSTRGSLRVRNVYFEAVPLHLVTAVVTDGGMLSEQQVKQVIQDRAVGYHTAFGLPVYGND